MADFAPGSARRQNALGLLVVAVLLVAGMWTANTGTVDYEAVLWSKPGRVWAVVAGLVVFLGGFWVTTRAVRRSGGQVRIVPLLAAAVLVGGLAYGFNLRSHILPASAEPVCKKGHAVNLDGVCAPVKKETNR